MSTPEKHYVNGTLFSFPELPPEDSEPVRKHRAERDALLMKAAKLGKHKTWVDRVGNHKPPKPGTGEFNPKAGEPGSWVRVRGSDGDDYGDCQIQFPARGSMKVWVSVVEGKMPVCVTLDKDKTTGSIG